MSTIGGPDITTDGLVLSLDAANKKSYPGSGTAWADLSGNSNNSTLTNGPTFGSGNGGSIVFDGTNQNASLPSKMGIDLNNSFSIGFWSNLAATGNFGWIHFGANSQNNVFAIGQYSSGGSIIVKFQKTSSDRCEYRFVNTPVTGTWEYYIITYNGSGVASGFNLYKNGVINDKVGGTEINTGTVAGINISDLGLLGYSASGTMGFMDGSFSNVHIYNRVLTQEEVTQNYNAIKARFGL